MSSERNSLSEDTKLDLGRSKAIWQGIVDRISSESDPEVRRKIEESQQHFHSSHFPQLIEGLSEKLIGSGQLPDRRIAKFVASFSKPTGTAGGNLYWKDMLTYDDVHVVVGLRVNAFSNGTILVNGGLLGSSVLHLSEWRRNWRVQKEALDKAVMHPKVICFVRPDFNFVRQNTAKPS